jgi:hypothetical protein
MDDETDLARAVLEYACMPLALLAQQGHRGGRFRSGVYGTKTSVSNKFEEGENS